MKLPNLGDAVLFDRDLKSHVDHVIDSFRSLKNDTPLWGNNTFESLEKSQLFLGKTLNTVFIFQNYQLHVRILPWVYRNYQNHGFHSDFFSHAINFWIDSIVFHYGKQNTIIPYLESLLLLDDEMREKAREVPKSFINNDKEYNLQILFLSLINHDREKSLKLLESFHGKKELSFASDIILPLMYEVGRYWEMDKISVADEHQISALISNFIASKHGVKTGTVEKTILITPAPNEFHEIGALLLSEEFRNQGWKVEYLKAGTSKEEIYQKIADTNPRIIAISIALILHARFLKELVTNLKKEYGEIPIILGGKFINDNREILQELGCEGGILDPADTVELAERIVHEKSISRK
jgi:methanogenic corrinoid protein MtbC1